jgi:hypothetical protein
MTQVLPASLVAPTRASQSVGYQIRAVDGTTIATAFTTTGVAEVSATGYYRVNGGITAPDDGGTLEWYLNNAGAAGAFLSAVAIEPAPNQADQAAGIRSALGLASANMDTQLSGISSKTTNLPASFPVVDGSGRVTVGTLNNDVITNAALAPSAITEIQAGLATQASLDTKASQASVDTKASQASVNAIPTTPLLAANYTAPDNAGIAAIKAKTDNLPSDPADQSELAALISAIPTVAPDNAGIAAIKAKTDNLPSDPADQSTLAGLINTRLAAADYVAPNNAGILTAISALPSAPTIADAVWDEPLSGHLTAGTTGAKLNLASTLTVGDIPAGLTAQQVWEYATRTLTTASGLTTEQNTKLNELWRKAQLDNSNPVVRTRNLSTGAVTETIGQGGPQIVHAVTNDGNTVTSTRQP